MTCSAFVRYKGFHYSKAIIFLDRVDFRNKRKKGQHLNSLCAVSTLPKGKNKIAYDAEHADNKGLRFYAYLTTIRRELVKITVAVRNKGKRARLIKQVCMTMYRMKRMTCTARRRRSCINRAMRRLILILRTATAY